MAMALFEKNKQAKESDQGAARPKEAAPEAPSTPVEREADAIYQDGELVAKVTNPEVDLDAKEIRFEEIYQSDRLLLPDECEFQRYKILVQRVAHATKAEPVAAQKGRVLKGVVADILGYREQ